MFHKGVKNKNMSNRNKNPQNTTTPNPESLRRPNEEITSDASGRQARPAWLQLCPEHGTRMENEGMALTLKH